MDSKKINDLISNALTNPDADMQYMKAQELTAELEVYYAKPVKQIEDEIVQKLINEIYRVFYLQLQSQYRDVQGNAIKQFQKLAPLMRSGEVKYIAAELLKSSVDALVDVRENYHICLQEIVEKISATVTSLTEVQETIIKKLTELKETVKKLQKSKQIVHQEIQQNVEIQAELLKILSSIMSRWPKLCTQDISDLLLDNIANQNEISIRKNSCVCLGYLGICLSDKQLNALIEQKILPNLKEQKYDNQNFTRCLYLNQSLNYLAKSSGKSFDKNIVEQIYTRFFKTVGEAGGIDFDTINQFAEILEIQLLTLNYLIVNTYARTFDIKLLEQITPLVDYDPLGVAAIEEENPYDDDYYVDETSDSTWRVRRCAIYTFSELLKIQPQLFKLILSAVFGPNQVIMRRMNEKNGEIKSSIIQFLVTLVQASAIVKDDSATMEMEELSLIKQRSIPSSISLIELIEQLLEKIDQIFTDSTEQQSLKSESTKLLLTVGQYFHSQIHSSNECFGKIVKIISQAIVGQQLNYANEQKIASLLTLKTILRIAEPHEFQVTILQNIITVLLDAVNQKYIRIVVEGYNTVEVLLLTIKAYFHEEQFKQGLVKIKEDVIQKIKIDNLDQDIKQSLFQTATNLLKSFPSVFTASDIELLAQVSMVRLQIEALTSSILGLAQYFSKLIDPATLISAIANLLQRFNKPVIYQCLIQLLQNNTINQQITNDIIGKFRQISPDNYEYQIHTLQVLIKLTGVKLPEQFVVDAVRIGLQQAKIKPEIEDFFHLANQPQLIEQQLSRLLGKEELYPAGQIYCSILKNVQGSLQSLYSTINQNRQLKLSALRFLHKYQQNSNAVSVLCKLVNENQDADLAALVIGAAVTQIEQLQELISQNKNQYLYYQALKEFTEIHFISNIGQCANYIILTVASKDKTISTICGDILGGFLKLHYQIMEPIIFEGLKSEQQSVRFACVQSLKYSAQWTNKTQVILELLQKERDISILTGIIKALTQNINVMKLNNLLQYLSFCLRRYEERELNFGNFVEKRDDAKDLRSLAFDLLEMSIDKQNIDLKAVAVEVFEKFVEDKYDETRIPRLRILIKILRRDPSIVAQQTQNLIKTFKPILGSLDLNLSKQEQNLDKEIEKIRLIVTLFVHLRKESKEAEDFYKMAVTARILEFLHH